MQRQRNPAGMIVRPAMDHAAGSVRGEKSGQGIGRVGPQRPARAVGGGLACAVAGVLAARRVAEAVGRGGRGDGRSAVSKRRPLAVS